MLSVLLKAMHGKQSAIGKKGPFWLSRLREGRVGERPGWHRVSPCAMRRKASKQEVGCTDRGSGKRRLCWHFALQLFLLNFLVTPVKMHPISNIGYFLIIKEYLPIKERLENTENYRKLLIIPTISLGATDVSCAPWVTPLPVFFFQQRCNCYMLIINLYAHSVFFQETF